MISEINSRCHLNLVILISFLTNYHLIFTFISISHDIHHCLPSDGWFTQPYTRFQLKKQAEKRKVISGDTQYAINKYTHSFIQSEMSVALL